MNVDDQIPDRLGPLVESFLARLQRGEKPDVQDYIDQNPDLADRLRTVLPTLALIDELGPNVDESPPGETGESLPSCPDRIGAYRIVREIGRGGMGIVYEAEQEALGRRVALKVLTAQLSSNAKTLKRFRSEARSAARLQHPHIVPVFDVGYADGSYYYTMQLIDGLGLDEVLEDLSGRQADRIDRSVAEGGNRTTARDGFAATRWTADGRSLTTNSQDGPTGASKPSLDHETDPKGPMDHAAAARRGADTKRTAPISTGLHDGLSHSGDKSDAYCRNVARIGIQVAQSLHYAHGQGILHRDIKPSNLLLDRDGQIWVTDFGLAKAVDTTRAEQQPGLTESGDVVGTIRYMAPERFRGWSDPRSDIYSLGLTLYELLTLRPAFLSEDKILLIDRVMHQQPVRLRSIDRRIPLDLETIVTKATEKEPAQRYQTAEELGADLQCFLECRPIRARRATWAERARQWTRRNPLVSGLAAILLLAIISGLISTTILWRRAVRLHTESQSHLAAANKNLDLAVSAVDQFCTKVSEDARLKQADWRPLRRDLLRTAAQFHEQLLELRGRSNMARIDLARAYFRLAKLTAEIDAEDRSRELYERAIEEFDRLSRLQPDNMSIRLELARAQSGLSRILRDFARRDRADEPLEKAKANMREVVRRQPDLPGARQLLGDILHQAAGLHKAAGRTDAAFAAYQETADYWAAVLHAEPDNEAYQISAASALANLCEMRRDTNPGTWPIAERDLQRVLRILQGLRHDSAYITDIRVCRARCLDQLGSIEVIKQDLSQADRYFTEALAIQAELVQANPTVLSYAFDRGVTLYHYALAIHVRGDEDAFQSTIRQASEAVEFVRKRDPKNLFYLDLSARIQLEMSIMSLSHGQPRVALGYLDKAISNSDAALHHDPENYVLRSTLPSLLAKRAEVLEQLGRYQDALTDWNRALPDSPAFVRPLHALYRAGVVAILGDHAAAVRESRASIKALGNAHGIDQISEAMLRHARNLAHAAAAVSRDQELDETERARLREEYTQEAVSTLKSLLVADRLDPLLLSEAPEFVALRDQPAYRDLEDQSLP